ncbi:hypothetical protein [Roseimicrobium sp. ORNL1]|uniref:hypothetical protein n=1 Tax=Roseimicrobium sp. ORNL1 TaxID=2711231 RepID=UPI0013E1E5A3|nr:hypothetical protein [Roseimicrobium sp. ORNL1]QIF01640.1 hypothetical protein G5S37_08925 [Roseimicrobium sp. ORNL1]
MRRHIRRLLLLGVALVITGLVFYIAAQWMVQNPLSLRSVELVTPEDPEKDWRHCLHYEIKNESRFPVVVHGLMWIDLYPDGGMGPRGPLFTTNSYEQKESFTLAPGETRREVFWESNISEFPAATLGGREIWLRYIWEPPIQERMSPVLLWINERYMDLQHTWKETARPLQSLTSRRNDVAGPAIVPMPSTPAKK